MRTIIPRLLLGIVIGAVCAEAILQALPVSTGYSLLGVSASDPILRGSSHARYVYSLGWNFRFANAGHLNNYGFRSSYDFRADPQAWITIGNSFVAADALEPRDNMTEQMGRLVGHPAYAIGVDGFSLADYLVAAQWAAATFWPASGSAHPAVLILLTTGDLEHSCQPRKGQHHLLQTNDGLSMVLSPRATPSTPVRLLNDSMLFRYVFDNLKATARWHRTSRGDEAPTGSPGSGAPAPASPRKIRRSIVPCATPEFMALATDYLLSGFRTIEEVHAAHVVFVVAPGYRPEQGYQPWAVRDVDVFAQRASQEGFQVVRLDAAFSDALREGRRVDLMPIDGHWNVYGNTLAAKTVAAELAGSPLSAVR